MAMAVASKVFEIIATDDFLTSVREKGDKLKRLLLGLCERYPEVISGVRGEGLMVGVECVVPNTEIVALLREQHLLVGKAGGNMIRLLPPLTVSEQEIDRAILSMEECFLKAAKGEINLQQSLTATTPQIQPNSQRSSGALK
jgi:acetylornithine/N-succinyldiaminopimelate aminotransferase